MPTNFFYPNLIYFYIFCLPWLSFLHWLKIILIFVHLILLTWMSKQCSIVALMFLQYQIYFLNIFYAFILDKFCFFEHANEKTFMQIHLTSFMEFTMILNQSYPFRAELLKNTHMEKATSNKKAPVLTKSWSIDIWIVGISKQFLITGS